MQNKLQDRVALVFGAASGIGQAIATLFHDNGAYVILVDQERASCDEMVVRMPGRAEARTVDIGSEPSVQSMIDDIIDQHGRIDVLINSAGILDQSPLCEMEVDAFDRMLQINLRGVFLSMRYVAPYMVKQQYGRIINISSQLALKGGIGLTHYTAAKAGILGLTKSAARELAPDNVLVNAIAPGPIMTPMLSDLSQDWIDEKQAELPLGRFGEAHEVAPSALMLASSPDGDIYVGQTLGPNSGDVM